MFGYAAVIVGLCVLAVAIAPEGANAATAVVFGGGAAVVMVVMGVLSLMIGRNRKLGMVGIHLGLLMPLVFAALFGWRIAPAYRSSGQHRYFYGAYDRAVASGSIADSAESRSTFIVGGRGSVKGEEIPPTDKSYLGTILTLLFGTSTAAFTLLLATRPEVPKAASASPDASAGGPKAEPFS